MEDADDRADQPEEAWSPHESDAEARRRMQEQALQDAHDRACQLEAEVRGQQSVTFGRLDWSRKRSPTSGGGGGSSSSSSGGGTRRASVLPSPAAAAEDDSETSSLVISSGSRAADAAQTVAPSRPSLAMPLPRPTLAAPATKRSVHWHPAVPVPAGDAVVAPPGGCASTTTPRSSVPRLTLQDKAQLHAARPDLAIVPDWVSRYRISQAPEVVMPDVCVLVTTVGAVCLALGLVMLLYLKHKHSIIAQGMVPHPYHRRGHDDR